MNVAVDTENSRSVNIILEAGCGWSQEIFDKHVFKCENMNIVRRLHDIAFNDASFPFYSMKTVDLAFGCGNFEVGNYMIENLGGIRNN